VRQPVRADKSVCGGDQGFLTKNLIFTPPDALTKPEIGLTTAFDPLGRLFAAAFYWASTQYTAFIDSFMRNVNERKSVDSVA
jgi:hypothetical protein